jgi:hypothetical protein
VYVYKSNISISLTLDSILSINKNDALAIKRAAFK